MEEPMVADTVVTEDDWSKARAQNRRALYFAIAIGVLAGPMIGVASLYLTVLTASGNARYFVMWLWMAVFIAPMVVVLSARSAKEQDKSDNVLRPWPTSSRSRPGGRNSRAGWPTLLDMAEGEPEVVQVIERSFSAIVPDAPIELLLADNSHAHLLRMASASPTGAPPNCCVDSPDHCPAARRAQVQRFPDSEELDACPKLRNRPEGAVSAVCVPVSIMGRSVGVIHATRQQHEPFADNTLLDLETLAKLAGARIGLLRVMAETQLQATTDSLTGLLNRRSFEHKVTAIRREESVVAMAMADLDHFKDAQRHLRPRDRRSGAAPVLPGPAGVDADRGPRLSPRGRGVLAGPSGLPR